MLLGIGRKRRIFGVGRVVGGVVVVGEIELRWVVDMSMIVVVMVENSITTIKTTLLPPHYRHHHYPNHHHNIKTITNTTPLSSPLQPPSAPDHKISPRQPPQPHHYNTATIIL